mmetsp:Transcript_17628/g.48404  ORF Transcript_17628/g.48404 Transcript_17628/m.48404 type:complete len:244 (+) Transcript_17628:37-768(+)
MAPKNASAAASLPTKLSWTANEAVASPTATRLAPAALAMKMPRPVVAAPWDRSGNDGRVARALVAFRRRLNAEARVHGSHAFGLADADSDVDVLVKARLQDILGRVRGGGTGFTLVEHVAAARVPRLVLRHRGTGVEVDAIEDWQDPDAMAKDELVRAWLGAHVEVPEFARAVRQWAREHRDELPRDEGYPNSFCLLLSSFWYLRFRRGLGGTPGENHCGSAATWPLAGAAVFGGRATAAAGA